VQLFFHPRQRSAAFLPPSASRAWSAVLGAWRAQRERWGAHALPPSPPQPGMWTLMNEQRGEGPRFRCSGQKGLYHQCSCSSCALECPGSLWVPLRTRPALFGWAFGRLGRQTWRLSAQEFSLRGQAWRVQANRMNAWLPTRFPPIRTINVHIFHSMSDRTVQSFASRRYRSGPCCYEESNVMAASLDAPRMPSTV